MRRSPPHHTTPEQITYIAYLRRAAAPSAHGHAASRTDNGAAAAATLLPSNGRLTPRSTQLSRVAQPKPIAMFNEIAVLHLACWGCFPWTDASCGVCCVPEGHARTITSSDVTTSRIEPKSSTSPMYAALTNSRDAQ
ncbi:hypothetical protein J1614_004343 [Plenodomus biglobosus]|nr:hypothetical protein J1614_004343 [Plenodomus biglobosus]